MRITKRQLNLLIEQYLLNEAVHDKVANQLGITDPERIEQLRIASEKPHSLQKPELLWIGKYFTTSEGMQTKEPIEDIVGSIKSLKQNKSALIRRGSATNLSDYESPGQINIAVSLSRGFVDISQLSEQVDVLYEDEDWTLYMPHSREASCTIGRGTSWCTAIPGPGNNLFYNYVIGGRAILYYLVKKKKEENEGPATTHFSLGTIGGIIPFPKEGEGSGDIVVDGSNVGLSKARFLSSVGEQLGNHLISVIEQHSKQNRNNHPAKNKVMEMLKNPALYGVEIRGKSIDARYDFTGMLTSTYRNMMESNKVTKEEDNLIADVFTNPDNDFHKLIAAATEIKQKDINAYETAVKSKDTAQMQKYGKIFADGATIKEAEYAIRSIAEDASLDESGTSGYRFCKNLDKLSGSIPYYYYQMVERMANDTAIAWQSKTPDEDYVIETDLEVTPSIRYYIEEDPTINGIESMLNKYFDEFIEMLGVYHANILIGQGYCVVHDPEEHNNTGQLHHENAGLPVAYIEDFIEATSDDDYALWWTNDQYPEYRYEPFTSSEIQNYMRGNFSLEFVDWCSMRGFTFT